MRLVTWPATVNATSASRPHGRWGTQAVVKPEDSAQRATSRSSPTSVRAPPVSEMNVPMRMTGRLTVVGEVGDRPVFAELEHIDQRVAQSLRRPREVGRELIGRGGRMVDQVGDRFD